MYTLEPYSPKQTVHPAQIMYKMACYHATTATYGEEDSVAALTRGVKNISLIETGEQHKSKEIQQIKTTQKSIIAELEALEKQLKAMNLKNVPTSEKQSKAKNQKDAKAEAKPESAQPKGAQKPSSSKQKDPGEKAKSTASPKAPNISTKNNSKNQNTSATTLVTSPTVVHAAVCVTCRVFPIHNYHANNTSGGRNEKQKFMVKREDFAWVRLFAEVGESRGVKFKIIEGKNGKNAHVTVEFVGADESYPLTSKVEKWKTLGKMLGVFCAEDTTILPITDEWLRLASEASDYDDLSRKLCRQLSASDFLCGCNAVCLADLVVRALFHDTTTKLTEWRSVSASNNVQLWVKRVDEALAALK